MLHDDAHHPDDSWQVRRAGLVDVNRIARMIGEHRPFIDLDGDGEPDEVPHPEHAGTATRLVLSLGGLEHGELWFAEQGDDVVAVAFWLPPDAEHLAQDLHRVIGRELDVVPERDPEPAHAPLRSIVGATAQTLSLMRGSDAERVLVLLSDDGRVAGERREVLLADVLAPVVAEQAAAGRGVLAVTVDPAQVTDLAALGFGELQQTPLGAASLWLGELRPAGVLVPDRATARSSHPHEVVPQG
ncbi:hypothetical protein [Cellulomonas sp. Marseille-Q8402]